MRPKQFSYTPADDSQDGLGDDVTGAAFTLTANDMGDGMAHLIIVLNNTVNDHSGKTLAMVGTDADGNAQLETMDAPAGSVAVTSTKYFKTLTSITPSATIGADTFDVGWTEDAVSPTFVPDFAQSDFSMSIGVVVTGTIDYDIQHTFDNPWDGSAYSTRTWFDHASIAGKTTNADGNYAAPVRGIRLLLNSLTAPATIKVTYIQGSK